MTHRHALLLLTFLGSCAAQPDSAWQTLDVGPFTLQLPPDTIAKDVQGVDSHVRGFATPSMSLYFDYGAWSSDLGEWPASTQFEQVTVDGRPARIGTAHKPFAHQFDYSTQIALRDVRPRIHLSVFANCKTLEDCQVARRVFLPIRFKS